MAPSTDHSLLRERKRDDEQNQLQDSTESSSIISPRDRQTVYQSAKLLPDEKIHIPCRTSKYRKMLGLPQPMLGKVDMVSLAVVYWITFVSEAARGLVMPSSWPYFESSGGTKSLLGVFVGVLSFGRMLVTMPLGYMSDKCSAAQIFYISAIIQIIGHFMYCIWPNAQALIMSRLIVGIGSSTLSVCRAYISRSIPLEERTHHFAYLSALQFIGFAVSPGLGSLLTYLPNGSIAGIVPLNGFTYPALLLIIFCVFILISTYLFYEDPQTTISNVQHQRQQQQSTNNNRSVPIDTSSTSSIAPVPQQQQSANADYLALSVCVIVNMVFRGLVAELETVTTPFLMEQYNLSFSASGTFLTIFGFFGLFIYSVFKPISRVFSDRWLIAIGLLVIMLCTTPLLFHQLSMSLPVLVYVTLIGALWSVAYPVGQTGALSLFSKVMKSLPPGGLLGIFSATGSGARIGFAVAAGAIWGSFGREAVYVSIVACTIASIGLVMVSWKRLLA